LKNVSYIRTNGGARSKDPEKFQKDAQVLEEALKLDPTNSRYVFYLAQSYRDAKDYESSIRNYEKRISMGGWDQEIYWSMLQIGLMKGWLERDSQEVIDSFYRAYLYRPSRAESLYHLASYYRAMGSFYAAYCMTRDALKIPLSQDILFVEKWIYDYGALFEHSISSYWITSYFEAKTASDQLLKKKELPESVREAINSNLIWINAKLEEVKPLNLLKMPSSVVKPNNP
jgi:tetratricopeptide (TPR) repeat protein